MISTYSKIYGVFGQTLRREWTKTLGFVAAVTFFSLGHAGLAILAGLLAKFIASPGDGDWVGQLGAMGQVLDRDWSLQHFIGFGLGVAIVKGSSWVVVAHCEAMLSASGGRKARLTAISRLLLAGGKGNEPEVLATVSQASRTVEESFARGPLAALRAMAQLVPLAAALILVSPRLALVGTLGLIPFAVLLSKLRGSRRNRERHAETLSYQLQVGVDELIRNLDLWRASGAGERIKSALALTEHNATRARAMAASSRAAISGMNEILGAMALFVGISVAAPLGVNLNDGRLLAFVCVFFMAYRPLRDLGDAKGWIARGDAALGALEGVVAATQGPSRSDAPLPKDGELIVRAVGAQGYGPTTSFAVAPGETLALTGPTGAGKTTLLRVLLGLTPGVGQMSYAGQELGARGVGPSARPFVWVPQEAPIVTGTLLENASLMAESDAAAERALGLIDGGRLQAKLGGRRLGPGGQPLSGGERRLVCLARALASEQPVLLLDEPCNGLDAESRAEVLAALRRIKGQRSIILVTHDREVLQLADRAIAVASNAFPHESPDALSRRAG